LWRQPLDGAVREARRTLQATGRPLDWALPLLFLRCTETWLATPPAEATAAVASPEQVRINISGRSVTARQLRIVGRMGSVTGIQSVGATEMNIDLPDLQVETAEMIGEMVVQDDELRPYREVLNNLRLPGSDS
jgi:hypothetical protein